MVFGGLGDGDRFLAETWVWDGRRSREVAAPGPNGRFHHAVFARRRARGTLVHYGGPPLDETWEWNRGSWRRVARAPEPGRAKPAMVYDTKRARTVLFGGSWQREYRQDLWSWDGDTWRAIAPE